MTGLAEYLEGLRPCLPPELVSDSSFGDIQGVAAQLPGAFAFTPMVFECRLGQPAANADFLVSLRTNNSGAEILSGALPEHDFASALFQHAVWRRARSFGRRWASAAEPFLRGVHEVWLEFDLHEQPNEPPLPCLLFEPTGHYDKKGPPDLSREELLDLVCSAHRWLRGREPSATNVDTLRLCLRQLRSTGALSFVGFMLSRPEATGIRIVVAHTSRRALSEYSASVGWGGSAALDSMLADVEPLVDHFWLHVDLAEGLRTGVGVECAYFGRPVPEHEPRWRQLLDVLVERELCLPDKREALLAFSGAVETDPERCPAPLAGVARAVSPGYSSFFKKRINSVKLVLSPGTGWTAKAYLSLSHCWQGFYHQLEGCGRWGLIG